MFRLCFLAVCWSFATGMASAAEVLPIPPELEAVLAKRYPESVADLKQLEAQVEKVATQAVAATVEVEVGQSIGSGVIANAEGLVLTAAHVIGGKSRPATLVLADGRRLKGHTLGAHHSLDAGMVQIDEVPSDLPFAPVAAADEVTVGGWVVATGQPGGILDDRSPPIRLGRILAQGGEWICTDCTLVGGDSGGPLFNMRGEVMAIHMSIGPAAVHNFHVPVAMIRPFWEKMLAGDVWGRALLEDDADGERVVLGIAGRQEADRCVVTQVFPGYPADGAGIEVGDIILAADESDVESLAELNELVLAKNPGDMLEIRLRRNEKEIDLDVTLMGIESPLPGSLNRSDGDEEEQP